MPIARARDRQAVYDLQVRAIISENSAAVASSMKLIYESRALLRRSDQQLEHTNSLFGSSSISTSPR